MAQSSFYSKNFLPTWPPVSNRQYADPQSTYWYELARGEMARLTALVGPDAADQWIEENVDENATWQRIHELLQRHVNQLVEAGVPCSLQNNITTTGEAL
jgi:hypothetical protein